jgi:hypothetical protein
MALEFDDLEVEKALEVALQIYNSLSLLEGVETKDN